MVVSARDFPYAVSVSELGNAMIMPSRLSLVIEKYSSPCSGGDWPTVVLADDLGTVFGFFSSNFRRCRHSRTAATNRTLQAKEYTSHVILTCFLRIRPVQSGFPGMSGRFVPPGLDRRRIGVEENSNSVCSSCGEKRISSKPSRIPVRREDGRASFGRGSPSLWRSCYRASTGERCSPSGSGRDDEDPEPPPGDRKIAGSRHARTHGGPGADGQAPRRWMVDLLTEKESRIEYS
jgi:hypothetical protein